MAADKPLTLFSLRTYLQTQQQPISMWQLTHEFQCNPEEIMPLIQRWMIKGYVHITQHTPCSGCQRQCGVCKIIAYYWQGTRAEITDRQSVCLVKDQ